MKNFIKSFEYSSSSPQIKDKTNHWLFFFGFYRELSIENDSISKSFEELIKVTFDHFPVSILGLIENVVLYFIIPEIIWRK